MKILDKKHLLSEKIIPSKKGVFYSYSSIFTQERSFYCLLKCKANKSRPFILNEKLLKELDLIFIFGRKLIYLCSPYSIHSLVLRTKIQKIDKLNSTEIRIANISKNDFYNCYNLKDKNLLIDIFNKSSISYSSVKLADNQILAIKTITGKYGLIYIKDLSSTYCVVDACHILL
jgi:hypothetical protein